MDKLITIAIYAIVLLGVGVVAYFYFKNKSINDIREDVYDLFLKAEHKFRESKSGQQKMDWVIEKAHDLLPKWAQVVVTEELLRNVLEMWFRAIKNLLDDGKF